MRQEVSELMPHPTAGAAAARLRPFALVSESVIGLGAAEAVDRRGVDESHAAIEGGANRGDGALVVGTAPAEAADRPGAEADARRVALDAGDARRLHGADGTTSSQGRPGAWGRRRLGSCMSRLVAASGRAGSAHAESG